MRGSGEDAAGAAGGPQGQDGAEGPSACYRRLLERYHRTLDLMSSRGLAHVDAMLDDAAAYALGVGRWAPPGAIVDVGSGAGLPGVVLAERLPERRIVWVERRRRRAAFLRLVAGTCGLANVTVIERDVRAVVRAELPATPVAVTAQAVAGFAAIYRLTRHLHGRRVILVARRGDAWEADVAELTAAIAAPAEVLAAEPLGRGGTLVVLSVPGGRPCR